MASDLHEKAARISGRLADLTAFLSTEEPGQAQDVNALAADLATALEELQVASEEIEHQNLELATSREAVEAERQRYQDLFDFAPDGYLVTDVRGIITEANRTAGTMLNRPAERLKGKPLAVFVQKSDRREFRRRLLLLATGTPGRHEELEVRMASRGSEAFPAVVRVTQARGFNGELAGLRWLLRDVSVSKKIENELHKRQELNQALLDALPHPALLLDRGKIVLAANRAARQAGAVIGKHCWQSFGHNLYLPEEDRRYLETHGQAPPEGTRCCFCQADEAFAECRHVQDDAVQAFGRTWDTHWVPLDDQTYLHYAIDITDRKAMELELADHQEVLERMVRERTAELDKTNRLLGLEIEQHGQTGREKSDLQDQLLQAQKMEAIGRLAGGVAHDFNNLMTVVTGYAERLLRRMPEADSTRRELEHIRTAGEQAVRLTRQLLAFGRRQVLQPQVLDLNAIIRASTDMLARLVGENIDVTLKLEPDLGRIKADPVQIDQVLMNLAINARDAMPEGGGLALETANKDLPTMDREGFEAPEGSYVMLTVLDTGCGMAKDTMERIFEPFFTTKDKDKGDGSGLGLSTVYGIIRQSGGDIRVYSAPGQGATFVIYLPRAYEAIEQREPETSHVAESPGGSETILLVEDEQALRELARLELEGLGYEVLEAGNVGQALMAAEEHQGAIQLLLTDVILPGLSGRRLYEILERSRPDIKVLYMSGHTEKHVVNQGVLDAGIAFMEKPFTSTTMALKVREVLDAD